MSGRTKPQLRARSQRVADMTWSRLSPLTIGDLFEFYDACRRMGAQPQDVVSLTEDTSFFTLEWKQDGETD